MVSYNSSSLLAFLQSSVSLNCFHASSGTNFRARRYRLYIHASAIIHNMHCPQNPQLRPSHPHRRRRQRKTEEKSTIRQEEHSQQRRIVMASCLPTIHALRNQIPLLLTQQPKLIERRLLRVREVSQMAHRKLEGRRVDFLKIRHRPRFQAWCARQRSCVTSQREGGSERDIVYLTAELVPNSSTAKRTKDLSARFAFGLYK